MGTHLQTTSTKMQQMRLEFILTSTNFLVGAFDMLDVHIRILIAEFTKYGVKCIENLLSHCANMTFADKSRYNRTFQQVKHKGGESAINYISMFQNAHALSVSIGNSYSEN